MPWCEECAKYWTPNAMREDGRCPKCGADLAEQVSPAMRPSADPAADTLGSADAADDDEKAPWHFKLLVVMVAVYLGWRLVQLFGVL